MVDQNSMNVQPISERAVYLVFWSGGAVTYSGKQSYIFVTTILIVLYPMLLIIVFSYLERNSVQTSDWKIYKNRFDCKGFRVINFLNGGLFQSKR